MTCVHAHALPLIGRAHQEAFLTFTSDDLQKHRCDISAHRASISHPCPGAVSPLLANIPAAFEGVCLQTARYVRVQAGADPPRRELLEPGEPILRLVRCRSERDRRGGGQEGRTGPERWSGVRVLNWSSCVYLHCIRVGPCRDHRPAEMHLLSHDVLLLLN